MQAGSHEFPELQQHGVSVWVKIAQERREIVQLPWQYRHLKSRIVDLSWQRASATKAAVIDNVGERAFAAVANPHPGRYQTFRTFAGLNVECSAILSSKQHGVAQFLDSVAWPVFQSLCTHRNRYCRK